MKLNAEVGSDLPVRREQIENGFRMVADLGPGVTDVVVDVLDDVAIVVVEDGNSQSQFEIEIPETAEANTFITNGILTIEVTDQ